MDGIHDLGGMQGFGPIDIEHDYKAFQHDWEGRMWSILMTTSGPSWTIDWSRHMVERMDPAAYLSLPYVEKWVLTYMTGFVTSGVFTLDEVMAGHTDESGEPAAVRNLAEVLDDQRAMDFSFCKQVDTEPAFKAGDSVATLRDMDADHTRLPGYARGRKGRILAHNGAHPLPDLSAGGVEAPEHLYTVVFTAQELWGDEAAPGDTVRLDLWESYLVAS